MLTLMIVARSLHFISLISLVGILSFLTFAGEPSLRTAAIETVQASRYRRTLSQLIWPSLIIAVLSGALWLIMEAQNMSGRSLGQVFARNLIDTVLTRTHFGKDWELRAVLALPLIGSLAFLHGRRFGPLAQGAALILTAIELAALAWAGHGGADVGWSGIIHVAADVIHLLAAGAWLGGLLPLALLFAAARRHRDRKWAAAARAATLRFSLLGIICVGAIIATGLINTWFLAGNAPALFGTDYGHLLLLKIALFLAMVGVAAINRSLLTPRLSPAPSPDEAEPSWRALHQLGRNALIEAGLGAAVLIAVGVLGTFPPGVHVQSWWPFPYTLSWTPAEADPMARIEVFAAVIVILGGIGTVVYGITRSRIRWTAITIGCALVIAIGWLPARLLAVTTYPTSFDNSPIPLTAQSVDGGAKIFAENCTACHGASGRGDGPLAKQTRLPPADLTAPHLLSHRVGDLFWWIGNGIARGGMPAFGEILSENQRWDVINFIRARASGIFAQQLPAVVSTKPTPEMPDFTFETGSRQETLHQAIKQKPILLLLFRQPESDARLAQLAASEKELGDGGIRLLAVRMNGIPSALRPDFVVSASPETVTTLALFSAGGKPAHTEYLIDDAGYLRARWQQTDEASLPDSAVLLSALAQVKALPLEHAEGHVHAH